MKGSIEDGVEVDVVQNNNPTVELETMQGNEESDTSSQSDNNSSDDNDERLVHAQFDCDNSNIDEERNHGKENVSKNVKM